MLAGCSSSTLLSPRNRLRNEASAQFQACHFHSMSTQRLDLPCTVSRKETSRSQPIRPVGLSVEKPIEAKTSSCSLKHNVRLPPLATSAQNAKEEFWEKGKSLKRFAEQGAVDESSISRAKRKKGSDNCEFAGNQEGRDCLSLGQLGSGEFWFQSSFHFPRSVANIAGLDHHQAPFSVTYSGGDEERVCFVPSEVISPTFPLSNNPWIDSVITEITDLGEKDASTSHRPGKEDSGSSTSSDSHGLGPRLNESNSEIDAGNGSRKPYLREGNGVEARQEDNQGEHQGFELVSLLAACVEAIGSKNVGVINHFIAKLGDLASPRGSPISRLSAYYTEALALRVSRLWPHFFHITPPRELDRLDDESGTALRFLNQVSPILKFIHFTANEILLRAFEGKDRVHIIDFDIKQGLQWPSFFQSLASRTNPPSHVRLTGIGEFKQDLNETGDRLAGFAAALNLPFEFHPVVDRLEDVRLWMLHVKEGESVAVNCIFQLHKTLYDVNGGVLRDFLGLIRSTNPSMVVMAEQEAEHNAPHLETRVCSSLKYYSAIFDSIDASLPLDSPMRMKIEELFAREIRNIVACEGSDRFERHETFEKWRKLMEQGGFRCTGVDEREMLQSQMLLKMYSSEEYRVIKQGQDGAALTLGWLDQPLYTVSAWAPIDVAGSSSTFSQPI
ncbi:GRAS family transcription factor [Tripterygium wilfordii]|uniref:GRAS family transcription factor n=1 Tax=Tripterygium wilfordii TaxID=458696 RepID=A0A7J7CLA2_TRIWF|nr:scarecrow-like protein 28 [Tripterygium wilfordii]KAF5734834.1 GRAS family transcription factor [Tripterygium wilfordii]